ncbi:hypothetical protein [Enterococcus gallinarum]|nr:hypothetical protein [Enterococcus gallinarum]
MPNHLEAYGNLNQNTPRSSVATTHYGKILIGQPKKERQLL